MSSVGGVNGAPAQVAHPVDIKRNEPAVFETRDPVEAPENKQAVDPSSLKPALSIPLDPDANEPRPNDGPETQSAVEAALSEPKSESALTGADRPAILEPLSVQLARENATRAYAEAMLVQARLDAAAVSGSNVAALSGASVADQNVPGEAGPAPVDMRI